MTPTPPETIPPSRPRSVGKRIKTLAALMLAAKDRRSVTSLDSICWRGPIPAAFMVNQPGAVLHRLLSGRLHIYQPKKP